MQTAGVFLVAEHWTFPEDAFSRARLHRTVVLLPEVFVPVLPLILHATASALPDDQRPRSHLHRVTDQGREAFLRS